MRLIVWVVEQFTDGLSQGYWNGGSSRSFVKDIDDAMQFCRRIDAERAIQGWHWRDVQITEHLYMFAVDQSAPAQEWEPFGKCQYDGCDGTRFSYDSGEVPGYGTFYCVKCYGAQIPLIPPQTKMEPRDPTASPPIPQSALDAEMAVYYGYAAARELKDSPSLTLAEGMAKIDTVLDGLKAARRFIFNSYSGRK